MGICEPEKLGIVGKAKPSETKVDVSKSEQPKNDTQEDAYKAVYKAAYNRLAKKYSTEALEEKQRKTFIDGLLSKGFKDAGKGFYYRNLTVWKDEVLEGTMNYSIEAAKTTDKPLKVIIQGIGDDGVILESGSSDYKKYDPNKGYTERYSEFAPFSIYLFKRSLTVDSDNIKKIKQWHIICE